MDYPATSEHIESEWLIMSSIGEGSFGSVFKAKKLDGEIDGQKVDICAIKKIDKRKVSDIKNFKNEIEALNKLKDKNQYIINYYGCGEDNENLYIYMEYIDGSMSISDKLKQLPGNRFEELEILIISNKLINALRTIHSNHIYHRDIKGANILLVDHNDDLDIKIIDFGLSKLNCDINSKYYTCVGSPSHMAPEVALQNFKAGGKSDIWSVACTIIEMTGSSLEKREGGIPEIPSNIESYTLKNIIQSCLIPDVNGRIDLDSLSNRMNDLLLKKGISSDLKFPFNIQPLQTISINGCGSKFTNQFLYPYSQNETISLGSIPTGTTTLDLFSFDQVISPGLIPDKIINLKLRSFNQVLLPGSIPNSVTYLDLHSFDQVISPGLIPNSVIILDLYSFNQMISPESIPNLITTLYLSSFDQEIFPGSIPNRVTALDLQIFNKVLSPGLIPNSVTALDLSSFNQVLSPESIPNSVKYLYLSSFNQELSPGSIPNSVTSIDLSSFNQELAPGSIPNSVTSLDLSSFNKVLSHGSIPDSVTSLDLSSFNQVLSPGSIPTSVKTLKLLSFNQSIKPGSIPNRVESLYFGNLEETIVNGAIPESVKILDLGERYDIQSNGDEIPNETLVELISGFQFIKPISQRHIPRSISKLTLTNYNVKLQNNSIPLSITHLTLGNMADHVETLVHIPSSVFSLTFYHGLWIPEFYSKYISKKITSLKVNGSEWMHSPSNALINSKYGIMERKV